MFWKKYGNRRSRFSVMFLVMGITAIAFLSLATPAQAHCDSEQGPVATAARRALVSGNVAPILPYVQPEAEAELTAAFRQALIVRKSGGMALDLADHYFVETAVRLHRVGEGAPYTWVTNEPIPPPIVAADKAMQSGSTDEVYKMLNQTLKKGLAAKYEAVVHARAEAARLNTVAAQRERVEAELTFEKYVFELFTMASGEQVHSEGATH